MTELFEPTGDHDWRLSPGASGLLKTFNDGLFLTASDLHVATRLGALGGEADERVLLAVASAVRAVRRGSVCFSLPHAAAEAPELPWPEPAEWADAVSRSVLIEEGVLRFEDDLLYLDRYHLLETQVFKDLLARAAQPPPPVDEARLAAAVARVRGGHASDEQVTAAESAVRGWTTILTGGPGTGKTTTVARVLALLADQAVSRGERLSVALSAPTGKAASRLQEAVVGELTGLAGADGLPEAVDLVGRPQGVTLHRLLGWRPDNATRFRHDRANRLKHDVVVVDESSMVELTMMARLLEALRPDSRLLLVGDPRQLTSVGAGAVLGDLVRGYSSSPASPVVELTTNFRAERDIEALAAAMRGPVGGEPDVEEVLEILRTPSDQVRFVEAATDDDVVAALRPTAVEAALRIREHAQSEDPVGALEALDRHRLLCAHREGPFGVHRWNTLVERWLAEEAGPEAAADLLSRWYVGRPLLVSNNDYALDVYNGETGVVVRRGDGRRVYVAGAGATGLRDFAPGRLDVVETMHAMTIHKSQGSQADEVTVLLPEAGSRLLTRELFYTAVTRARFRVRIVGTEAAVRAAVTTRAQRASGLAERLGRV